MEILCVDARENFEANKQFLTQRAERENNRKIAQLLAADRVFLDDIQLQTSTAREFLFAVRMRGDQEDQAFSALNRIEKQIAGQGFECKRASKEDIKRFLSKYFGILPEDPIDDFDGARAAKWGFCACLRNWTPFNIEKIQLCVRTCCAGAKYTQPRAAHIISVRNCPIFCISTAGRRLPW